ncbi:MAG: hypothetical protein ACI3V4_02035 [Faecousia sp.]
MPVAIIPSFIGGPAQAGSDEAGMHPDQCALKEPRTEKGKQDNGFPVYYGWHKPSVRTNLIRPSVRAGAPSPKGKAWALPRHSNHPTINDHLQQVRLNRYGFRIITLFVIGIIVFTGKLVHFACKAAWGITKGVLFVMGIPTLLIALFVAGLVSLAIPILVLALLAAFLWPVLKGVSEYEGRRKDCVD